MDEYKSKLYHSESTFLRETYERRMEKFGFKNIARMELFLWDLELFLHIQEILQGRIVLKGGAATQFFLPKEAQRTSVDIDIIFCGTKEEIEKTLKIISDKLCNEHHLFEFREHIPKVPKTALPLYTYHVVIPTILEEAEMQRDNNKTDIHTPELKIEFIIQDDIEIEKRNGMDIFAVQSEFEYNLLPLNNLFADKLTTMGPNTIGVQDFRIDEQVKQFYDIWMLTRYHFEEFNIKTIREKYITRAKQECASRGIEFDLEVIKEDVLKQLYRYSSVDSGEDPQLKRIINNFKSLYLNAEIEYNPLEVACAASLVKMIYENILNNDNWYEIKMIYRIAEILELKNLSGRIKGFKTRELKEMMITEFSRFSNIPPNILKGKGLLRVFWAVVDKENLNQLDEYISEILESLSENLSNF